MGEGIIWSQLWGKRRAFEGEGDFCCTSRGWRWLILVFEWECLNFERVFERLRESVWVGVWNCSVYYAYFESYKLDFYMTKFVHVSGLTDRKRVLKARVLIGSRVFKTQNTSFTDSFKIGQLTILLDILCYLARVFFLIVKNIY